jgi:hypothetical protein
MIVAPETTLVGAQNAIDDHAHASVVMPNDDNLLNSGTGAPQSEQSPDVDVRDQLAPHRDGIAPVIAHALLASELHVLVNARHRDDELILRFPPAAPL